MCICMTRNFQGAKFGASNLNMVLVADKCVYVHVWGGREEWRRATPIYKTLGSGRPAQEVDSGLFNIVFGVIFY